jgi:parvulin-like peptidyl-prolyl isomerase
MAAITVAATLTVVLLISKRISSISSVEIPEISANTEYRTVAARVDSTVLYTEDLAIAGIDPSVLRDWTEDELLASLAEERGLENVRRSRLLQDRVRQIYLRDELLSNVYITIPFPDSIEVFQYMLADSLACLVERHYYQILVADRYMADSIYERLSEGENFQITAERLSIGQKAGIGGDLGFLTAGELIAYGVPREDVLIDNLGRVTGSSYGWHIFMVDEIRPLEDTARVMRSLADDIYRQHLQSARDSLLEIAASGREVFIDPAFYESSGQDAEYQIDATDGREAE